MGLIDFEFVPFGGDVVRDPFIHYDRMRAAGRLLRTSWGGVLVHRYEDVRALHADHDDFSMSALGAAAGAMGGADGPFGAATMLDTDPPDHERLRRVVSRAFTPRSIAALEPRIRSVACELLAPLRHGQPFDIVADFAAPLPTIVIAELLGIPAADRDRFRTWTDAITGTDVRNKVDASTAGRFQTELRTYLADQIDQRKHQPTDDLIGRMLVANADQLMSDDEVVAACVLLLVAGNETTMRLIANMALNLGRHRDQLEMVSSDHSLLGSAVEETLRYEGPVQMMFRGARQDTSVGGIDLRAGTSVLTMLGAANRDPDVFAAADTFDVTRTPNHHISFGHGIHYCLGASLARLETRVAFEELLADTPGFVILTPDEELEYPQMLLLRSPRSLVLQADRSRS